MRRSPRELAAVTGTPVRVTATADETFDGADILVEASRLTRPEPLLRTSLVRPGAFVVPYGTISAVETRPAGRDGQGRRRRLGASRSRAGSARCGRTSTAARCREQTLHAELGQIVAGLRPGRERPDERILLWHRGLSILDIALGQLILDLARARRRGHHAALPVAGAHAASAVRAIRASPHPAGGGR